MNQIELGTILHMEKGKKPKKQRKEIEDGFLPYVDIKAFDKALLTATLPRKSACFVQYEEILQEMNIELVA